jgi:hypothetical protein
MNRWYRAYVGTCTDRKLASVALRANVSKSVVIASWHLILESAAESNAGGVTSIDEFDIAAALGEPLESIQGVIAMLRIVGLFADGQVTAWKKRQYETDRTDATNAERQRRFKERKRLGNGTVTERKRPETETETETDKKESVSGRVYFFEAGVIRLNRKDFESWSQSYANLDLRSELTGMAGWAEKQGKNWFHAVAGLLAKRNREQKLRLEQARTASSGLSKYGIV